MSWPDTDATHYHAQLGLQDNGQTIKGLVVCDLLNGLDLGFCYQPYVVIDIFNKLFNEGTL